MLNMQVGNFQIANKVEVASVILATAIALLILRILTAIIDPNASKKAVSRISIFVWNLSSCPSPDHPDRRYTAFFASRNIGLRAKNGIIVHAKWHYWPILRGPTGLTQNEIDLLGLFDLY